MYYWEEIKILIQQTNKANLDSFDEEELIQIEMYIAQLVDGQPFKCLTLKKPP